MKAFSKVWPAALVVCVLSAVGVFAYAAVPALQKVAAPAPPVPGAFLVTPAHNGAGTPALPPAPVEGRAARDVEVESLTLRLNPDGRLKGNLDLALVQREKNVFRVYVAVYDAGGHLLATAAHEQPVEKVMLGRVVSTRRTVSVDFGASTRFEGVALASVAVSDPPRNAEPAVPQSAK